MEEFLHFLDGRMSTPTWFGWYHLLWIGITIASCVLIFVFRHKFNKKAINIILLCLGIALILFELYKQIIFSFNYNGGNGNSTWDFQWYAFPFQFCSTPMYLMLLAGILRKGKVYDAILGYLATYAMFAGLLVMIYTGDVFTSLIGINIHTMFWHSSMFILGFLLLATRSVKFNIKTVLKATIVFVVMLAMALTMNIIWHYFGNDETFNMFYISPYYPCTLPVLSIIYDLCPYVVFLILYIIGFMLAASVMMGFTMLFNRIHKSVTKSKKDADELVIEKILAIVKSDL